MTEGSEDDLVRRDAEPAAEFGRARIAPPITLKAFLARPLRAEDYAILEVLDALGRAMVQAIDAEAGERRSP